jgi:hypothetical protein
VPPCRFLENASFENGPSGIATTPHSWINCGHFIHTPPDVFASDSINGYSIYVQTINGQRCLGLVVRSNNTSECVFQDLTSPLEPRNYEIQMVVSRPTTYDSGDPSNRQPAKFNQPVVLKFRGVDEQGESFLIHKTNPIRKTHWEKLSIPFQLDRTMTRFMIRASHDPLFVLPYDYYNGGVLIDAVTIIER